MRPLILSVDDSSSMRQLVRASLEREGYAVVEAEDGLQALEMLDRHPIKLLITDLNMPNLDGLNLIRQVRTKAPLKFLPILMLTTEERRHQQAAGKEAGASGWIVKPFVHEQLLRAVRRLVG